MKRKVMIGVLGFAALFFVGVKVGAIPDPLKKPPSFLKFNSITVKAVSKAPAGQALLSNGNTGAVWGNVEGVDVASDVAGSPAANGSVLTANGAGKCTFAPPGNAAPSGPAGGDLAGTYPNPTIAAGVIPTTLPPSGPAGGGLSGSYPNPTLVLPQSLGTGDSPTFANLTLTGATVNLPVGSVPVSSVASSPIFGNGADGDVTISVSTTLTQDMYYNNLTVNTGISLNSGGFRIFVKGTCTLSGAASIRNNGSNGAGVGGAGAPTGSVGGGTNGGNGTLNSVGGSGGLVNNGLGGTGGTAGAAGNSGGSAGSVNPPLSAEGGAQVVNAIPNALTGRLLSGTIANGGSGGGGGGTGPALGAGGGGGGGGGGVVMIAARRFAGAGTIQANGGNGTSGPSGGGGGGGGCVIIVTTGALPGGIVVTASGGNAGANGPNGTTPAQPGTVGKVVILF